ncbi:MAG: hypothetical protein ABW212_00355, partial [Pseudonocardia sediminis]
STRLAPRLAFGKFRPPGWRGGAAGRPGVGATRHPPEGPPSRQMRLARALPGAEVVEVDGNHDVFLDAPGAFAHALTAACLAAVTVQSQPDGSEQAS